MYIYKEIFKYVVLTTFLTFSVTAIAQNKTSTTIVDLKVDNDLVFVHDRYYTSGISLEVYSQKIKKSPIINILLPSNETEVNYYSMSITHNMYTPERTLTPNIQYTDHPYASYLLIGTKKMSFNLQKRIKKTSEFEFGMIGPMAGGELIQNRLHENIAIAEVSEGWHNQIQNDICLQYSATIEKGIINLSMLEVNGFVGASVGVPYTEAQLGGFFRFGFFTDFFKGIGIDLSPDLNAWFYCSGSVYLVKYNATLQGGVFNQNNVHTINPINNLLLHGRIGGVVEFKRFSAEYGMEVRSPEFNLAFWHRWGHLGISYAF